MQTQLNPEAWCGLEDLAQFLRRVVGPRCRDESELDDVVQEACMRAARYRASLADEVRLKPWAARIALNVLADRITRSRDQQGLGVEDDGEALPAPEPDESAPAEYRVGSWLVEREEAMGHLGSAMAGLRVDDRRLLDAFYKGGESCRHVAEVCDLTPKLAKVRLFRARRRLLKLMRQRVALGARRWVDERGGVHDVSHSRRLRSVSQETE